MTLKNLLEHTFDDKTELNSEETRQLATIVDDCGGASRLKALAAALAYGLDEDNAKKIIIQGQYTFFDADNNCQLGRAIVKEMGVIIPDGIAEYFDYKRLGEDYTNYTNGKFTNYGFFTPGEFSHLWWLLKK